MHAETAPPRAGPSPPDAAAAAHDLGFPPPPPPAGPLQSRLSSSFREPRHGSEHVPGTEDDPTPKTPGSAEFFLGRSDDDTPLAHTEFTCEQQLQLKAQLYVWGDLRLGKPSAEQTMVHAFGEPEEAWEEVWRAAVDRWETQKPLMSGFDTPPSSSLIGSCTVEQGSTVRKSTISEQDDGGEKETQGLDVGSATIHPPKNTTEHTEMLEQKNGDEDHLVVSCAQQMLPDDGSHLKKNAVCGGKIFLESHCSLPKNSPGRNMADIRESCHSRNKSGPNSPHDIQESSSSQIGSCIAEQGTDVGKTFITEQHNRKTHDGGEEASQGPFLGSAGNYLAERSIDKVDQVLCDDVNNSGKNTVCGGQTLVVSCFQCGKGGELLKCRSCTIAAHRSCFGSSVRFDGGQFDCPLCFCYKAEKTLSEARKSLSAFLRRKRFAKQHYEQSTGNQQLSRKDEELGHGKKNDARDVVSNRNIEAEKLNGLMNSPMTGRRQVRFHIKETVVSHSYAKALGRQVQFMHSPARKRYYPQPPECHSSPATPARRSPLASTRRQGASTVRRKMTRWTKAEEAALREGVAKYLAEHPGAAGGNRNISWVRILEDGRDSFNPARRPCDLGRKFARMKQGRAAERLENGRSGCCSSPPGLLVWKGREEVGEPSEMSCA